MNSGELHQHFQNCYEEEEEEEEKEEKEEKEEECLEDLCTCQSSPKTVDW